MNDPQQPESETETDAATPEERFSERLASVGRRGPLQRILDSLYGYDYFISYKWSDGRIYALSLAEKLQEQGFDCFLDSEDYLKGDNWKSVGERALKKTTRLVLVGSPEVHQSEPVLRELKIFSTTKKDVIPINFDTSLSGPESVQSPLAPFLDMDAIFISEPIERLAQGPSPSTVVELQKSFTKQRQSQKRARAFRIAGGLFALLIAVVGWVAWKRDLEFTDSKVNELVTKLVADDVSPDKLSNQFNILLADMKVRQGRIISNLESRNRKEAPTFQWKKDDEKDQFAKSRAHAAIVLVHFGESELAKEYLDLNARPEPLAQFAARCGTPGGLAPDQVIKFAQDVIGKSKPYYDDRSRAIVGYSALLGVGEYPELKNLRKSPLGVDFLNDLEEWFCNHHSAAIHSACGWLLGRVHVAKLNEKLAIQPGEVSLESAEKDEQFVKEWFVVKLQSETDDEQDDKPVEYITFIRFQDDQHKFAVADREATVGVCDLLGESGFFDVLDDNLNNVDPVDADPVNAVNFENAKRICAKLSARFPKLRAHLPNRSQWAFAWGNPDMNEQRVFQFGKDEAVLDRYAKFGLLLTRPDQVATHRPSMTGMFDMHGNVAEWTMDAKMRGGAAGQPAEFCKWIPPNETGGEHKGFRFCLSRIVDD